MNPIWQVFFGGMVGTFVRYIIGTAVSAVWMLWIVNIIGSFLLGAVSGFFEKKNTEKWKLFFTTGLLGSFTTFSSFSEQWFFLLNRNFLYGTVYGIGMLVFCLCAALLGYKLSR